MTVPAKKSVPRVGIVIPVYDKLDLTRACVESIHRKGADVSFEIVVVDNGSTDGTGRWLDEQEAAGRLRAVGLPQNRGFAKGCNLGAKAVRSPFLLFLNNDMEVTPDWLEPLVATLDRDPTVGAVGSKLLYPDGTIQHAGVALLESERPEGPWLEGTHLALRKPADWPAADRLQRLQAVTGACLMVRREEFEAVGGFDEGYWNGNEDVDLCLKLGAVGKWVVYRPESVIVHHESKSGPERWARVTENGRRLNEIWGGKARPDFRRDAAGSFTSAGAGIMGPYTPPRLCSAGSGTPPGARDTVSVVVLTWNALEYTRQCAESLLRHTDSRHELLFVDNGSRSDTIEYLAGLAAENERVRVLFNGENLGFAAGNNRGIAAAKGRHVCLLNSDTVVTAGWLEGLLSRLEGDSGCGLVGPVTNSITGGQCLPRVDYDQKSLAGLPEFAAEQAASEAGRSENALWVVGFCTLIRRELIERIGGLDEGFGQGNYEDTDYCLRAFLAGYRSVVAHDVFVHHFGSRSFVAGGVDYAAQIDEKFEIFRRKWDLEPGARGARNLDLGVLVARGFQPALHFHPLPAGPSVVPVRLPDWEARRWVAAGEEAFQAGHLGEAERIFRAVLRERSADERAAGDLACVLWAAARTGEADDGGAGRDEAAVLLEGVLARNPANQDAAWNLAEIRRAAPQAVHG